MSSAPPTSRGGGGPGDRASLPGPARTGQGQRQTRAGWLFVTPMVIVLGLFLVLPIVMALWVRLSDWNGQGSPFGAQRQLRRRGQLQAAC